MRNRSSDVERERFKREVGILTSGVQHRAVVTLYEWDADVERPWYISELGESFPHWWRLIKANLKHSQTDLVEKAVSILLELASALASCHDNGVVHRDIKPNNLIVKKGVADPWPILIDFGIAHEEKGERLTLPDEAVGNARFSPDIMRNRLEEVPPWLDVFDLSQLLIWMLDKGAPKDHWARPIHWNYAVYNETVPMPLQLSVRAFTGACSSSAISPADGGEVVSLLSILFPRQVSTKVGGIDPNVIVNAKRQGTANRLIAESNAQEEIEGSAPLAEYVYEQLRDTLLSVLKEVSQQEPSKRIIQNNNFHYALVGATDLLWVSLGPSPNNIHLRIKVKVVPWSDPPRADKKRKENLDFWRQHMARSAIPLHFRFGGRRC